MSGKDFEDQIWHSLEDAVGDAGVVLLRRQSFSARAGHGFQADQVTGDLLVDSPEKAYYIGIECKTINSKYRFYFNGNYDPDQIRRQMEYGEVSGRDMFVALEARGDEESRMGWEEDRAFLFPIEMFAYFAEEDGSKVTYEDMETFGYLLGADGDYDFSGDAVKHARSKKAEFQRRLDGINEKNLDDYEEE
jgi:hypothetical protein